LFLAAPATGSLSFVGVHQDGVNGMTGLEGARGVAVSPDGAQVYVAAEYVATVTVFDRDPATGSLTLAQTVVEGEGGVDGLSGASGVALSPDGAHLYVAGAVADTIAVFARDPATGELTFVQVVRSGENGVEGIGAPRTVVVSPDGRHVYAPGTETHSLSVFERDAGSGMLTFAGIVRNGVGGVEGLTAVRWLALSPDGAHACAAGYSDAALTMWERDPDTGLLSFVQVLWDGENGGEGLMFANSCTFSPDGSHVYSTAGDFGDVIQGDRAVSVFDLDPLSGELTFKQMLTQEAIANTSVTVSPDGLRVYVPGARGKGGIGVYARDPVTGELRLLQFVIDGENGVDGLGGVFEVALSPDGAHLYGAAHDDNAVTVFRIEDDICCGDANGDGQVTIDELVTAVNNALGGCPE